MLSSAAVGWKQVDRGVQVGAYAIGTRRVAATLTIIVALLALYGWFAGQVALPGGGDDLLTIGASTAVVFILLSVAILSTGSRARGHIGSQRFSLSMQVMAALIVLPNLADLTFGTGLSLDRLLLSDEGFVGDFRTRYMSVPAAVSLVALELALAIGWMLSRRGGESGHGNLGGAGALLAASTLFLGLFDVAGHAYGTPLIREGASTLPALPTGLGVVSLSVAVLALILPYSRVLGFLTGPKVSAQLLRWFVPSVAAVLIFDSIVEALADPLLSDNPALWRTVESLAATGVAVLVILFISRRIGGEIDTAKAEVVEATSTLFLRSEELKTTFNNTPVGLVVAEMDGTIIEINPALRRMLGYRQQIPVILPKKAIELVHQDDAEAVAELIANAKRNGMGTHLSEHRIVRHDGSVIWMHMSISAVHGSDGDPVSLLFSLQDVSALKEAHSLVRERDEQILRTYADVIQAMTGDRLVICTAEALTERVGKRLLEAIELKGYSELSGMRRSVGAAIKSALPDFEEEGDLMLAIGEGAANMIKHGDGGTVGLFVTSRYVQVLLEDFGPGIDFSTLPQATLRLGFSTKSSLGAGFTIMLETCDRITLSTEPGRTLILLEKRLSGPGTGSAGRLEMFEADGITPIT